MAQTPSHPGKASQSVNPKELEQAENIAYTLNHAIACTATDFIDPFVGAATQKWLGKRFSVGCGSHCRLDHHHDHGHEHEGNAEGKLKFAWAGELAGDFGSVPITVAIQKYAPGIMDGIRKVVEPVAGPVFRKSAERAAKRELSAFDQPATPEAIQERAQEIYNHEMRHLPQAVVWTASSVTLNVGTQKVMGNNAPLSHMLAGKAVGAGISSGLMVGARAVAPGALQKWDRAASEKVYVPLTKKIGKVFGVDEKAVDAAAKQDRENGHGKNWTDRVKTADNRASIDANFGRLY